MSARFTVAVAQCAAIVGDLEGNTERALALLTQAHAQGADLVLFPECFLTGYAPLAAHSLALGDDVPYLRRVCEKARALSVGAVVTALTRGVHAPRNTAFVIGRDGRVLMRYDKVHTCDFSDEACLESGEGFFVCDFDGVQLGVMICYDREYPESARVLMLQGAELILVPNDCGSMAPRVRALSTRAYENMAGVVMANPPGENAGCSCAFSPICWDENGRCVDNTLLLAGERDDGLLFAVFDLDALRRYRSSEMMGNTFRKTRAYAPLLDARVAPPFVREGCKQQN